MCAADCPRCSNFLSEPKPLTIFWRYKTCQPKKRSSKRRKSRRNRRQRPEHHEPGARQRPTRQLPSPSLSLKTVPRSTANRRRPPSNPSVHRHPLSQLLSHRLQRSSRIPTHRQRRSSRRPSPRQRHLNQLLSHGFPCHRAHVLGKIGSDGTVLVEIIVRPEIVASGMTSNLVAKMDASATIRNRIRLSDLGRPRLRRLRLETAASLT